MLKFRSRTLAILFSLLSTPGLAATINYQDWWWNASQSGQGVNIGQQGTTLFASWFTYDQAGVGMYLVFAGSLTNNKFSGDLVRTTGPVLGSVFDPNKVIRTVVGQASISFSDANNGVMQYTVNGISGSLVLTRFSFATLNPSGAYLGAQTGINSGCASAANNGGYFYSAAYAITTNVNSVLVQEFIVGGANCSYSGTYTQNGSRLSASGVFSCGGGFSGTWSAKEILVLDDVFAISNFSAKYSSGEICEISNATLTGSKLK